MKCVSCLQINTQQSHKNKIVQPIASFLTILDSNVQLILFVSDFVIMLFSMLLSLNIRIIYLMEHSALALFTIDLQVAFDHVLQLSYCFYTPLYFSFLHIANCSLE